MVAHKDVVDSLEDRVEPYIPAGMSAKADGDKVEPYILVGMAVWVVAIVGKAEAWMDTVVLDSKAMVVRTLMHNPPNVVAVLAIAAVDCWNC